MTDSAVGDATDGFSKQGSHGSTVGGFLGRLAGIVQRNGVGDHHFVRCIAFDAFNGRAGEHSVQ